MTPASSTTTSSPADSEGTFGGRGGESIGDGTPCVDRPDEEEPISSMRSSSENVEPGEYKLKSV